MAYQRHTQSFRGLVRERLAQIENEFARGIDHATVLSQLGVPGISGGMFRDALYEARRRAREAGRFANIALHECGVQGQTVQPTVPRNPVRMPAGAGASAKPAIHSLRDDFLSISKMFNDEEIVGRKSK